MSRPEIAQRVGEGGARHVHIEQHDVHGRCREQTTSNTLLPRHSACVARVLPTSLRATRTLCAAECDADQTHSAISVHFA